MYVSPIANDILAGHLINYGAVSFMTDAPMRLKSGLVTPHAGASPPCQDHPAHIVQPVIVQCHGPANSHPVREKPYRLFQL